MQTATLSDRQLLARRGREDPVWWIENILGAGLWSMQRLIAEAVRDNQRTSVASCHGPGKSFIAARIALWFLYNFPPAIVITTAPTDRQVKGILWKEIRVAHSRAKKDLGGRLLTQELNIEDDWFALGFSTRDYDPDRFQGFHGQNILVIVDEAAGVSQAIHDGIEGLLSGGNAKKLMIGNPTDPLSEFGRSFGDPKTARFHVSAFDTPNFTELGIDEQMIADGAWQDRIDGPLPWPALVDPQWVSDKYRRWGPGSPLYTAKVKGQFPAQGRRALIPLAWFEAAFNRELEPDNEDIALGIDVAREGPDSSPCYCRRGQVYRLEFELRKAKTTELTGRAIQAVKDTGATRVNVDVIGIGSGVVDNLEEHYEDEDDITICGINFGASPTDDSERFANLKSQLYWQMRERYERGEVDLDPEDDMIAAEGTAIDWKLNSKGKIAIEPKEKTREKLGRSPDRFEAQVYSAAEIDSGWELIV